MALLGSAKKGPGRLEAAQRLKRWTRERFALVGEDGILVSELESTLPGYPPLHTVVAFWTAERKHYHFKVFKPLEEVLPEDLPPAWLKDALAVAEGLDCGCC
jgi:hypothetical protein